MQVATARSLCGCLTATGLPCSRETKPNTEFCWQHDIKKIKDYLEKLPPVPCYTVQAYTPLFTILYSREQLEQFSTQELISLHWYYNVDWPLEDRYVNEEEGRFFTNPWGDVIRGVTPELVDYEVIYKDIIARYYPLVRKLTKKELLIESLLYVYRLMLRGIRLQVFSEVIRSDYNILKNSTSTFVSVEDFVERNIPWVMAQIEQLLPFLDTLARYIGDGYTAMNNMCRNGKAPNFDPTVKLLHAFNFAEPLSIAITVYRYLVNFPDLYKGEGIEKGFMSTSIRRRFGEELQKHTHYMILHVPKGAVCLGLLLFGSTNEAEILFPPGTRFRIMEEYKIENTQIYEGMIY